VYTPEEIEVPKDLLLGDRRVWKNIESGMWATQIWNGVEWKEPHESRYFHCDPGHFDILLESLYIDYYRPKYWPHTQECDEECIHRNKLILEWKQRWPKYCKNCKGYGQFYQASDFYDPGGIDPCEMCTAHEGDGPHCARCGENGLEEDGSGPCTSCGWNYDDGIPPEIEECNCLHEG